jgi:DNA topoisomerase I
VKPGYIAVYQEGKDDGADDDNDTVLPPMQEGDAVSLVGLQGAQHFTEPPPRFSEASLVKALEEHGIGRPSTYASIISTLKDREYVDMDARRFIPTDIGKIVNDFLSKHFHKYVEYGFTAALEDELDAVSRGEEDWREPLTKFWAPFKELVDYTEKNVSRDEVAQSRELGTDPASGKPVSVRMGRFGPFVQIGTRDDVEKPKFAGLRPGQKMDKITFDEAMYLFLLPRNLGATADGEPIDTNIGRFGPYVKYGAKYASLKEDDPYTITLERALEVIAAKQLADANRLIIDFGVDNIQVLNGRYGPYITDKERNARMPKDRDPKTLTLEECRALLAAAPQRFGRGRFGKNAKGGKNASAKGKAKGKAAGAAGAAGATGAVADGASDAAAAAGTGKGRGKAKSAASGKAAKAKKSAAAAIDGVIAESVAAMTGGNGSAAAAKPKAKAKAKSKAKAKAKSGVSAKAAPASASKTTPAASPAGTPAATTAKAAPARGKPAGGSAAKD